MNSIAREFVYGGHLLALGTSSIAAFSAILLGYFPSVDLLLTAYLFSYGAYVMNRVAEWKEDALSNPKRTEYLASRKRYLPAITAACFVVGYLLAAMRNLEFFLALLAPLILSSAYSVGSKKLLSPLIGAKRLKEKLLVKNIAISVGWSLIPILVGLYYQQVSLVLLLVEPFVFLRLLVNTIFFDERDMQGDRLNGIKTLPTVYGVKKTNFVLTLVDLISAVYVVLLVFGSFVPLYSAAILILPAYSMIYRMLASRAKVDINFLCDVVGDGEYILWGAMLFLGRIII